MKNLDSKLCFMAAILILFSHVSNAACIKNNEGKEFVILTLIQKTSDSNIKNFDIFNNTDKSIKRLILGDGEVFDEIEAVAYNAPTTFQVPEGWVAYRRATEDGGVS